MNIVEQTKISSVCRACLSTNTFTLAVRPSLDVKSTTILANSLVSSRLDYYNSLYYELPDTSLDRLQRIQNSLARVVLPSFTRNHHITPALHRLHWLPIRQRIMFKIATITYKTLFHSQPSYLHSLLKTHNSF